MWQPTKGEVFHDGDQFIAAVPVRDREFDPPRFYWDIAVVTVDDEGSLWLGDGDDAKASGWGWQVEDVDWFIPLDGLRGGLPDIMTTFIGK